MANGVLPQRPEFEVTVRTQDGVRVVAVTGELDLDTMRELNAVLAADDGVLATTVLDLRGLTLASAAGHGMMWGPAVARIAVDLALHGATTVTDVSLLGLDRFDAAGRSSLAADPIALPFPAAVGP